MKIAITTPTGKIGSALTERLLNTDHELVLLARDATKVKSFTDRGAKVETGSLDDKDYVTNATRGVDVLFFVIPPDYGSDDYRAFQNKVGDVGVAAITANKIPRVVFLSSVAAHLGDGFGPISGLGDIEKKLEKTNADVIYFRPGYFMENNFMAVQGIAADGAVYLPMPGSARVAAVAVTDIAKLAQELIQDTSRTGKSVVELAGPEEVSFNDAAQTIGKAIGKDVSHVEITSGQMLEAFTGMGISKNVTESYIELYDRFREGKVVPEVTPKKGETTFKTFAEQVFRPGYKAMTQ